LILAYAAQKRGIAVPKKWNQKSMTVMSSKHGFIRKRRQIPSVRGGFIKAMDGDRSAADAEYHRVYSDINRALRRLHEKWLIDLSTTVTNINFGGKFQRQMGVKYFTFFRLTEAGRQLARDRLRRC
jgi:hypothetical protein